MSIEARLLTLLDQVRHTGGDAALHDPSALRSRLSSQAPDLHGEIQAMAAALAMGAPGRIAAAADAEAERVLIAREIAKAERLALSVVEPGLAVACQRAAGVARPPSAESDAWAGDSMAVGVAEPPPASPTQPPQPAAFPPLSQGHRSPPYPPIPGFGAPTRPPPFYTQIWFFALIAGLIILAAIGFTVWRTSYSTAPTTAQAPQPSPRPSPPPAVAQPVPGGPELSTDANAFPVLPLRTVAGRYNIGFRVVTGGGPIDGAVLLPAGGWDGETAIVAVNGAGAQAVGSGSLRLAREGQGDTPTRSAVVRWTQDGVGAGDTQILFIGQAGEADVALAGSVLCITDAGGQNVIGCGAIR